MKTVRSYGELLEYAYDCLAMRKEIQPFELAGNYEYNITVEGVD